MKIKNIIKKSINFSITILMLFIIALTFSACAQVRVMTITNDDDTIDELVTISISVEDVLSSGYDVSELKLDIQTKSQVQAETMKNKLNDKIFKDLLLINDKESADVLNSYYDGISVVKSDWKDNMYSIGIRFKNMEIYKYYYGINDNIKTETYTEEHFFYNKVYYYGSTMYVKHHDLYDVVNTYYSAKYPNLINSKTNELLYTYKTDLRRQHSDADYIIKQNGEYYHTWVVDPNNLDEPIMLYYNIANPENWIIVGVLITLGVAIVLSVVAIMINLIKNRKKEDN